MKKLPKKTVHHSEIYKIKVLLKESTTVLRALRKEINSIYHLIQHMNQNNQVIEFYRDYVNKRWKKEWRLRKIDGPSES